MEKHYTLEYWQDDDWYVGRLREIPGVFSQGESLKELEDNIADAFKMVLSENIDIASLGKVKIAPIPRHPEIKESLCRIINSQLGIKD